MTNYAMTNPAMTKRASLLLAVLSLGSLSLLAGPGAARADDGPPKLDVEGTCKSAERVQRTLSDNADKNACLNSERSAEADLKKRWGEFPAAAKRQCTAQFQAGGFPSYVELITCLELASGAVPTQPSQDPGSDVGGRTNPAKKEGSSLTREPAPTQRTNPIETLQQK